MTELDFRKNFNQADYSLDFSNENTPLSFFSIFDPSDYNLYFNGQSSNSVVIFDQSTITELTTSSGSFTVVNNTFRGLSKETCTDFSSQNGLLKKSCNGFSKSEVINIKIKVLFTDYNKLNNLTCQSSKHYKVISNKYLSEFSRCAALGLKNCNGFGKDLIVNNKSCSLFSEQDTVFLSLCTNYYAYDVLSFKRCTGFIQKKVIPKNSCVLFYQYEVINKTSCDFLIDYDQIHGWGNTANFYPIVVPPVGVIKICQDNKDFSPLSFFKTFDENYYDLNFACYSKSIKIPNLNTYIMNNSSSIIRISDSQNIPVFDFSISIGFDDFGWSLSASMPLESKPFLDSNIKATINGYEFIFSDFIITENRTHGGETISLNARGLGSELDYPISPELTFFNSTLRSANQLMDDILKDNGVPIGWTVDWGIDDWNIPAGLFSHTGSRLSALLRITEACGAVIECDRLLKVIHVKKKYRKNYEDILPVDVDIILTESIVLSESKTHNKKQLFNAAIVTGTIEGIIGSVVKTGTAGDLQAPMFTNQLITSQEPARLRGQRSIIESGDSTDYSLSMPLNNLIVPLMGITDIAEYNSEYGVILGISLSSSIPDIEQVIKVEFK